MLVATLVQLFVVMAAPIVVARWLRDRWPLSWGLFWVGGAGFVASQIVHIPFNAYVLVPAISGASLPIAAVALGLSAGVCEEIARYLVMRYWRKAEHKGPHALMLGAGHGGIESMIVGLLAAQVALNLVYIERIGIENLGLAPQIEALVRTQFSAPAWVPLLGAFERLMTLPFHISASCMVMIAVAKRRPLFLILAIAWHGLFDAGVGWIPGFAAGLGFSWIDAGALAELWVLLTLPASLAIIARSQSALATLERETNEPRPDSSGAPLELVAVRKHFGEVRALDGIDVVINKGERVCLLGPNGAGKTTAIRIVNGALAPTRGHAFLFGVASREPRFLEVKRRAGVVPQQPGMYHEMTVRQYLSFVADLYCVEGFDEVAARLGVAELMDRKSNLLSGGQQRRLSLCAALMSQPDLLILDEPSAGLDPVAAREMKDLLKEVSRDRTTVLCTHDLDEAEELCETVVILRRGKVLVHDSIAELKRRATARLALRATQGTEALALALRKRGHDPKVQDGAVEIVVADGESEAPQLLRELLGAGLDVYDCRVLLPSLEELFLQLVDSAQSQRNPTRSEERESACSSGR